MDADYHAAFALCGLNPNHILLANGNSAADVPQLGIALSSQKANTADAPDDHWGVNRATRNAIYRGTASMILCEIQDLAQQNDRHGRAHGDMLLHSVSRRLERILRSDAAPDTQMLSLGGARFAIVNTHGSDSDWVQHLGMAIIAHVATAYAISHHAVQPKLRVSGAVSRAGDSIMALARRAAMARPMKLVAPSADMIPAAIKANMISMLYQPQYDSKSDAICGVEALARWRAADGAERGAAALVAAALSEQHVDMLGHFILDQVLRDMKDWPERAPIAVAINILPDELLAPDYARSVLQKLQHFGVSPDRLTLEITEHNLIDMQATTMAQLHALRAAGARIALDDFGTGFSSLAYLKDLPVDILKIDAGFSRDAAGSSRERAILATIIQLARTLDVAVVAEGIETEGQLHILREMGISYYQGFLKSPAVSVADLGRMLQVR
jgi:EAL domain-containing protein (putative c-di-GMP-specific phosphodiesterase class I)/GGDEF domain-containing protein